jgi:hypothetical protein
MKRLVYQTALFAYVNAICFRNFRPTCTKISEQYNRNIVYDTENPYVSHDRLQRLLVLEEKWNRYLQQHYSSLIRHRKGSSKKRTFLIIDDTVIAKPYSKELDLLSWIFSPGDRQYLYGINVVFVLWTDGETRFPIGFRIWYKEGTKTKIDLAMDLLRDAKKIYKITPSYVLMDSFYPAAKLVKVIRKYSSHWIAKIKSNRLIDGIQVEELFKILKSELRLEGCSARESIAQINHMFFVLIAFCQLESFRVTRNIETIYEIRSVFFDCIIPKTFLWNVHIMRFA